MKDKLITIYREKEIYTLFYDPVENKMYRFPHRKKSTIAYLAMFFVILYGSDMLNDFYANYKSPMLNIALFVAIVIICYLFATFFLKNYYIPKLDRTIFLDENRMRQLANQGMKQLRLEVSLGLGIGMFMALIGFVTFFIFSQIQLLIVGGLGLIPLYVLGLMRPFTRHNILKKFQSRKIKL